MMQNHHTNFCTIIYGHQVWFCLQRSCLFENANGAIMRNPSGLTTAFFTFLNVSRGDLHA